MSQIFLDTNVILDYLESRKKEVKHVVNQLLSFHKDNKVTLVTSFLNVAELIDKEFDIHYLGKFLKEKMSFDEIMKMKRKKKLFREIAYKNKDDIKSKVEKFILENKIDVLYPMVPPREMEPECYDDLYNLIYENQLSSKDAFIVFVALTNDVTYFLSNDEDVVTQVNERGLLHAYNLREKKNRQQFTDSVLKTFAGVLK